MPTLAFPFEIKTATAEGEFEGLAATYGNEDSVGDMIEPGAFTKTLASAKDRPLFWQHSDVVGVVRLEDSPGGLKARGRLTLAVQRAREAYALLKDGAVRGLSIGFETIRSDFIGSVRHLREIKLWEVSLTPLPANEFAGVTAVKSAQLDSIRAALRDFRTEILSAMKGN